MNLWILRHARASDHSDSGRDRDRPLSERGRQACQNLNAWLQATGHVLPRKALVSPALRTQQTAELAFNQLPIKCHEDDRLWMATCSELVELVDGSDQDLFLVSHNPGLEALVHHYQCDLPVPGLKPGTLVIIDLADRKQPQLLEVVPPNEAT